MVLAALAAGWAAPAPAPGPVRWDWHVEGGVDGEKVFAGHQELLDGFVAGGSGCGLSAGDRLLLGFHVFGDDLPTTRFVELEVVDPISDARCAMAIRATVFDEEREPRGTTTFTIRGESLPGELHAVCARFADGVEPAAPEVPADLSRLAGPARGSKAAGIFVLAEMVRVLQSTPLLRDLLWECVSRPGLFTLLTSGPAVSFGVEFENSERVSPLFDDRPAYRFPFLIRVAGEPALRCTVVATDSRPPLALCGGVIAVHGESLDASPDRVLVRVLAAHQAVH